MPSSLLSFTSMPYAFAPYAFAPYGFFFFFLNHTAFKLNSLWHAGYLRDNICDLYVCSRFVFLCSYSSARRPDFTKPPRLSGPWALLISCHPQLPSIPSLSSVFQYHPRFV